MTTVLLALALVAQAPLPDTVRQAHYERTLSSVSDSLNVLRGAIAAFPMDLGRVSPDLVVARAARVRQSCHGVALGLEQVSTLLAAGVFVPHAKVEQGRLQSGTTDLRRTLTRCEREWGAPDPPTRASADSLRAWGPYRGARLDESLRAYLGLLRSFMKQAALKKPAVS